MNIWFYSDPHFGHENIWRKFKIPCPTCREWPADISCFDCGGSREVPMRPFSSTQDMDDAIVNAINASVRSTDHLWWLGDMAMRREHLQTIKRINCKHQRMLWGNHDIYDYKSYTEVGIKKFASYKVLDNFIFSHIPLHPRSLGRFTANIHGHIHHNDPIPPHTRHDGVTVPYINISCEATNYQPVDLEWIRTKAKELRG